MPTQLSAPIGVISADAVLQIDGADHPELNAGLLSVLVEETSEGLYRCEARFGNWGTQGQGVDYLYFDRSLIDFGKELTVRMGADEGEGEVFVGRISAIEGQFSATEPPSITILAEDRLQDLRMTRRTRVFEDMSDSDAFQQIAGDHGLQGDIDADGPTHKLLAQVNQSDLAFIRERARWLDADVWVEDTTLHVQKRANRIQNSADDLTLTLGRGLLEFSVTADLTNQHTSVVVSGWDVSAKDQISYEADDSTLGSELGSDDSGASILQSALGERVDRLVHHVPLTSSDAQALAEATFRAQARRFVYGTGMANGDARLRVGVQVQMSGLGPLFDGAYTICEARHIYARQAGGGYHTEIVVERPGLGRP
jgi:phage protein D